MSKRTLNESGVDEFPQVESPSEDCPDVGIYYGVSFQEYCEWDAINHSRLQRIDKSPLHCHATPSRETSQAMRLGQLVHAGKLEPQSVDERYAVMPQYELLHGNVTAKGEPSISVATAFVKERRAAFEEIAQSCGQIIVTQAEYDMFLACLDAMLLNQNVTDIINRGQSEASIIWHDAATGLRCKARLDSVSDVIMDLKTSRDDSNSKMPESFEYSMFNYNYYSQAAWYRDGWHAVSGEWLPFWFAVVSTTPPITCVAAPVGEMTLRLGRKKNEERMQLYAACNQSGVWPGYKSPELFELPERYFPEEVM